MIDNAVKPGVAVSVRISWKAWTTLAPGLLAARTPDTDTERGFGTWQLMHEPTGYVVAHFDGPEQAQAAAAKLVDVDWLTLTPDDRDALSAMQDRVTDAVDAVGGSMALRRHPPSWEDEVRRG